MGSFGSKLNYVPTEEEAQIIRKFQRDVSLGLIGGFAAGAGLGGMLIRCAYLLSTTLLSHLTDFRSKIPGERGNIPFLHRMTIVTGLGLGETKLPSSDLPQVLLCFSVTKLSKFTLMHSLISEKRIHLWLVVI